MAILIVYSLVAGLLSLVGGLVVLWQSRLAQRLVSPLMAFGAGAFLAAALVDILPEALEGAPEPQPILMATLGGFVIFFTLERLVMRLKGGKQGHRHSEHTESLPFLLVLGDSIHNFIDGVVIALAFVANPLIGLPTALAIAAHEIPQEIGDFSILLNLGWDKKKVLAVNVIQSLLTIPGVILGVYLGRTIEPYLALTLGATAGIFLYIAASDVIPQLHHYSSHKHVLRIVLPMIGSILALSYLSYLAHLAG
jgi:zinc and cadmium transporter